MTFVLFVAGVSERENRHFFFLQHIFFKESTAVFKIYVLHEDKLLASLY